MQQQSGDGVLPDIRTIGRFEVNELNEKPTKISSNMEDISRPIAWEKINRINSGERVEVGKNCKDFYQENLNDDQRAILSNTEWIERAVGHFKPDSKDKLKIFARTAVLCDLVTAILQPNQDAESKDFEFVFNKDKKELKIWAIESKRTKSVGSNRSDMNFGPFVEATLTTEDPMSVNDEVRYGNQSTYQLTELSYPGFVVYTSKEIDAIDNVKKGGEEFPIYEIKSFVEKKNLIGNILIKNAAFTDKKVNLIIAELEQQGENQETTVIKQIRIVDNVESLDGSNLVKACRRELGKGLDSILELVKDFPNGTLTITYQGIQLNGSNGERAIATKSFSPKLNRKGNPVCHNMCFFKDSKDSEESDEQYLHDPTYKFKLTWPLRDSQDFENFLEHGFTNRKKEKYVFVFPEITNIPPNVLAKLKEEGYVYDQKKTDEQRELNKKKINKQWKLNKKKTDEQCELNKKHDTLHCFVLEGKRRRPFLGKTPGQSQNSSQIGRKRKFV